jgi:cytochrome c oxidase subunit 4
MTKEWQEATEEYLKVRSSDAVVKAPNICISTNTSQSQGSEPITGYKGMMVQSKSEKDLPAREKLNDE